MSDTIAALVVLAMVFALGATAGAAGAGWWLLRERDPLAAWRRSRQALRVATRPAGPPRVLPGGSDDYQRDAREDVGS